MNIGIATIVLTSALAFGANATTTGRGAHGPLEASAASITTRSFEDMHPFNPTDAMTVFNGSDGLDTSDGMKSRFKEAGSADIALASFASSDGANGRTSNAFEAMTRVDPGLVNATGTGSPGGPYIVGEAETAVPEAQTYALMLGGLAMIGFVVRRRRV